MPERESDGVKKGWSLQTLSPIVRTLNPGSQQAPTSPQAGERHNQICILKAFLMCPVGKGGWGAPSRRGSS